MARSELTTREFAAEAAQNLLQEADVSLEHDGRVKLEYGGGFGGSQRKERPDEVVEISEEQVVYAIRQADAGTPAGRLCRQSGVSEATFYAWKKKYAHLGVNELRRLRQVEEENSRLKRLVADLSLDNHRLSRASQKTVYGQPAAEHSPNGFTGHSR